MGACGENEDVEQSLADPVKAVVFDLDDTLFDHTGAAVEALRLWLPTVGVAASDESIALWFAAEERHVAEWRAGRISWAEQRRGRLRDVLPDGSSLTQDELDARFTGYLARYEAAWRAFPDVEGTLFALAACEVRVGILTNGATAQQRAKLAAIGLADRFEFVLTTEDLGVAKPHPEAYLAACRRFGCDPAAVMHIGDLPDLDVAAPREAGLRSLLIDREGRHGQGDALRSLGELPGRVCVDSQA
jgi:putative hydrolase of the HAD superfamily